MSSGSILLMCLLCFALGGQDRLPWAPGLSSNPAVQAASTSMAFADEEAVVRSKAMNALSVPQGATAAPIRPTANRTQPNDRRAWTVIACAAGFALLLPPSGSAKYAISKWLGKEGVSAAVHYDVTGGGWLKFTRMLTGKETSAVSGRSLCGWSTPVNGDRESPLVPLESK
jgi:hypothetical protein